MEYERSAYTIYEVDLRQQTIRLYWKRPDVRDLWKARQAKCYSPPTTFSPPARRTRTGAAILRMALERVASLKQDYQQRIAAAAPADKERILNEAVNALAKAVTDQGLSVEEYDSILEVAQNDPDVREKIRQRIRPSVQ
jgi:hypothetical protein